MNIERKEDRAKRLALVAAIAQALGGTVKTDPDHEHSFGSVYVVTADGTPLRVSDAREPGRLRISVDIPDIRGADGFTRVQTTSDVMTYEENNGRAPAPTADIGISEARGAEAIARAITSRLIKGATELYTRGCKRRDEHEAHDKGKAETIAEICAALKCNANGERIFAPGCYMTVSGPNSVHLERVYVTAKTALKIHALIAAEKGTA
jgi:hypothetical protein